MPELRSVEIYGFIDYDYAWNLAVPTKYDPENTREIGPEFLRLK
jgi:hypothetical protein